MIGFPVRPGSRTTKRLLLAATMGLALGAGACDTLEPLLTIGLATPTVQFRAVRGTSTPLTQTITVSNAGSGRLGPVTCPQAPASWLTCTVNNGNSVVFTASPAGLSSSPATVSVPLTAPGASQPVTAEVSLTIDQPVLGLSTSSVSFSAAEGASSTSPGSATITLSNTGAGTLENLSPLTCVATPPQGRVGCQVSISSGALVVTVDPNGLAPGSYLFPVTVSSANSSVSQTFSVALTVNSNPRIALSPNALFFSAVRGAAGTQSKTVTVTNTGTGSLGTVTCPANPASWLSCSVSGSTVTFTVNSASQTSTPSAVTVPISASGAANSPQNVTVNLQVDQPVLTLNDNSLFFTAVEGVAGSTPVFQSVQASNTGSGSFSSLGTLSCTQPVGITCTANSQTGQVTISASGVGRTPGLYSIPVVVSATNSSVSRALTVVLQVAPNATLVLSSHTVAIFAPSGSTTPVSSSITFSNSATGSLGDVSCPANPASWLACSVDQASGTITFTANPSGLVSNPTPVDVPITAANAPGQTEIVNVSLSLSGAGMQLSTSLVSFTGTSGSSVSSPASAFVTVTNPGGSLAALGALSCTASGIVSCSVDGSTGIVTINVNPTSLSAGNYLFVVQVSSALGGSQFVTVQLTVS
jgi:hypothetical protein